MAAGGVGSSVGGAAGDNGSKGGWGGWGQGWSGMSGGSFTIGFNSADNSSSRNNAGGPTGPNGNGGGNSGSGSQGGTTQNDFEAAAQGYQSAVKRVAAQYGISEGAATRLSMMMTAKTDAQRQTLRRFGNSEAMAGVAAYDKLMQQQQQPPAQQPTQNNNDAEQQRQAQAAEQQRQAQAAEQQRQQQAAEQQRQQQAAEAARQEQARQAQAAEQQRQQQAAEAARQEQARQAQAAEAARQEQARQEAAAEAARQEKARQEQAYQDNLSKVRDMAKSIGENSVYGTGNLETNRQYNDALAGIREEDRAGLADTMSNAREAVRAERQKAQEQERDTAENAANATAQNSNRVAGALQNAYNTLTGFLNNPLGQYGGANTVGGTLANGAKWGMRGMETAGPVGGVLGLIGGMIANNVDQNQLAESLRGYNPTGLGGTVAGSILDDQAQGFTSPLWNRDANGGRDVTGKNSSTGAGEANPSQPKPQDKQANAAINSLIPQSARSAVEAGQLASNQYLRALRGRYAKYMLATGAEGSGTSLLQRTAGGQGALGGTSGRLLYQTGGNG